MKLKHTPLPWKSEGYEIIGGEGTPDARVICRMSYGHVSPAPPFNLFDQEHRKDEPIVTGNMLDIVRAVNNYSDLVDAAKAVVLDARGRSGGSVYMVHAKEFLHLRDLMILDGLPPS